MSSAIILLHGSGDCGDGIREWVDSVSQGALLKGLQTTGTLLVTPDAPAIPYTLAGGGLQTVWFDRKAMAYKAPEDVAGVARSLEQVDVEVDKLVATGVPLNRIGIVGMSMGGCMALHAVYGTGRHAGQLAFAAAMSTFLAEDSKLDSAAVARFKGADASVAPPLFIGHGDSDPMINPAWAEQTRVRLEAVGVAVPTEVPLYKGMGHDMCKEELDELAKFINQHLSGNRKNGCAQVSAAHRENAPVIAKGTAVRVRQTGRVGEVLVHDPEDASMSFKIQFADGEAPAADWFSADAIDASGAAVAGA